MPIYIFKCDQCNRVSEGFMSFKESEQGFPCKCGGYMNRIFTTDVSITGTNPHMRKPPGIDAKQDRMDGFKSLEKRKHMRLRPGGIL